MRPEKALDKGKLPAVLAKALALETYFFPSGQDTSGFKQKITRHVKQQEQTCLETQ